MDVKKNETDVQVTIFNSMIIPSIWDNLRIILNVIVGCVPILTLNPDIRYDKESKPKL
jgi:hypothetical protein